MNLGKLLPNSAQNKTEEQIMGLMYLCMCEWGWSYQQFLDTPISVIKGLTKYHNKVTKKKNKK